MKYHPKSPVSGKNVSIDSDMRHYLSQDDVKYAVELSIKVLDGKNVFWAVKGEPLEPLTADRIELIKHNFTNIVRKNSFIGAVSKIIEESTKVRKYDLTKSFPRVYLKWFYLSEQKQILTTESAVALVEYITLQFSKETKVLANI